MSSNDYYANHRRVRQFPWSLYHRPLEADLQRFLRAVSTRAPRAQVLVIGCGLMQELDVAPAGLSFTVADIDARAVDVVVARGDPRVACGVVVPDTDPWRVLADRFDAIYAKEVIEHIVDWRDYLLGLRDLLLPGGALWLSTPNYGAPWLSILEHTALELVARMSGFTRRGLHVSPLSRDDLSAGLVAAEFVDVDVRVMWNRLALAATATRQPSAVARR